VLDLLLRGVWITESDVRRHGVRKHETLLIHDPDLAAISTINTSDFNPDAAYAAHWTAQQLTLEDTEFLSGLPLITKRGDFTLVHGSLESQSGNIFYQLEMPGKILPNSIRSFVL
jgi:hypothetical protein